MLAAVPPLQSQAGAPALGGTPGRQTERGKTTKNDRLLGVAVHSYQHEGTASIDMVEQDRVTQVEALFISYNRQKGKTFNVTATSGHKRPWRPSERASAPTEGGDVFCVGTPVSIAARN